MTARVLLVTGSRALYDTAEARAWTLDVLRARLRGSDAPTLVVTGDARGADAAASEIVRRGGPVGIAVWELDGDVTTWAPGYAIGSVRQWTTEPEPQWGDREGWKRRPLQRNVAMVAYAQRARCLVGVDVRCLALLAPWSASGGTQHTMRLAREHGLPVEVLVCPEAYGPRGSR